MFPLSLFFVIFPFLVLLSVPSSSFPCLLGMLCWRRLDVVWRGWLVILSAQPLGHARERSPDSKLEIYVPNGQDDGPGCWERWRMWEGERGERRNGNKKNGEEKVKKEKEIEKSKKKERKGERKI